MSQPIQGDNSSTAADLPVKRKRGRPRKDQTLNRMEITQMPPGFEGVKEKQPRRADAIDDANDQMVGQAVTGVVEAAFDGGYLLTVRIGNSATNLRGVVFKPGHYVPVTAENDVAPHAQMIRRNEIIMHGRKRSKNRTRKNGSPSANHVLGLVQYSTNWTASKGKYAASTAPSVPLVGARGTVVPVVLQPVNLSNGLMPQHRVPRDASQDMMSLRDDEVHTVEPLAMLPPDVSAPTGRMAVGQNQSPPSQLHAGQQVAQGNAQHGSGSFNGGATMTGQEEEGKSIKSTEMHTPGELTKEPQRSSPSSVTDYKDSMSTSQSLSGEANLLQEQPFQAVNSDLQAQSASVSKPLKNYATGRMTELLLALQENMPENQVRRAENLSSGSGAEFNGSRH